MRKFAFFCAFMIFGSAIVYSFYEIMENKQSVEERLTAIERDKIRLTEELKTQEKERLDKENERENKQNETANASRKKFLATLQSFQKDLSDKLGTHEAVHLEELAKLGELLKTLEARVQKLQNAGSPEEFAKNLNFLVALRLTAVKQQTTSDGLGHMEITSKDSVSGFVIDYGGAPLIISAGHVPKNGYVSAIDCFFADGHPSTTVDLAGWSEGFDVAVFQFKDGYVYNGGYAELGDSSKVDLLTPVVVLGSPEALTHGSNFSASYGYVMNPMFHSPYSGPQPSVILHWAISNSGNSGGPLLDARDGKIIGLNIGTLNGTLATYDEQGREIHRKFETSMFIATPANDIARLLPKFTKGKAIRHGYIRGLKLEHSSMMPVALFKSLEIEQPKEDAPIFTSVMPKGAAEKAGLVTGDTLVSVNGIPILEPRDFFRELMMAEPGSMAELVVKRNRETKTINIATSEYVPETPPVHIK